ncbi:MAG TPA: hydrogenase, partial [Nitratifractor sp.]|nr:hydrogenase [Nitratifractor sp.]
LSKMYEDFLWDKQEYLEENREYIESLKKEELKVMYPEFWEKDSPFHGLRREFVYKICPRETPVRLKSLTRQRLRIIAS